MAVHPLTHLWQAVCAFLHALLPSQKAPRANRERTFLLGGGLICAVVQSPLILALPLLYTASETTPCVLSKSSSDGKMFEAGFVLTH